MQGARTPIVEGAVTRCVRCGYDLRGLKNNRCPECGAGAPLQIHVSDPNQFHIARAALEREGLLLGFENPGGTLGTIGNVYGVNPGTGWLWADSNQRERVQHCLDEAGIASSLDAIPIVDKSEPICPKCGVDLEVNGPEVCANCGAAFMWVEIEAKIDPTDQMCHNCGYELTGNTSQKCPECNAWIMADPEAQLKEDDVDRGIAIATIPSSSPRRMRFFVVLMTLVVVAFAWTLIASLGVTGTSMPIAVALTLVAALVLALIFFAGVFSK